MQALLPFNQAGAHTMPTPATTVAMLRVSASVNFFCCRTSSSKHTQGMISSFVICSKPSGQGRAGRQHSICMPPYVGTSSKSACSCAETVAHKDASHHLLALVVLGMCAAWTVYHQPALFCTFAPSVRHLPDKNQLSSPVMRGLDWQWTCWPPAQR